MISSLLLRLSMKYKNYLGLAAISGGAEFQNILFNIQDLNKEAFAEYIAQYPLLQLRYLFGQQW